MSRPVHPRFPQLGFSWRATASLDAGQMMAACAANAFAALARLRPLPVH